MPSVTHLSLRMNKSSKNSTFWFCVIATVMRNQSRFQTLQIFNFWHISLITSWQLVHIRLQYLVVLSRNSIWFMHPHIFQCRTFASWHTNANLSTHQLHLRYSNADYSNATSIYITCNCNKLAHLEQAKCCTNMQAQT